MIIKEIRKFANEKGIVLPKKATKEVLIHTIQVAEGNNSCYATKKIVMIIHVFGMKIVEKLLKIKKAMNKFMTFN